MRRIFFDLFTQKKHTHTHGTVSNQIANARKKEELKIKPLNWQNWWSVHAAVEPQPYLKIETATILLALSSDVCDGPSANASVTPFYGIDRWYCSNSITISSCLFSFSLFKWKMCFRFFMIWPIISYIRKWSHAANAQTHFLCGLSLIWSTSWRYFFQNTFCDADFEYSKRFTVQSTNVLVRGGQFADQTSTYVLYLCV